MSLDLSVKELNRYLPHRPPMIWIDKVIDVGTDYKKLSGTCQVQINPTALYCFEGGINGSAAVEFTAQAFGYLKAAYQVTHQFVDTPSNTYLTGVRSCKADFSKLSPDGNQELQIEVSVVREIQPLTIVRGTILNAQTGEVYAQAEIQVYVDYATDSKPKLG